MTAYEWLLVDSLNFIYNFIWLVFLANRHFGQVTTTAGHIFELNVLLNVSISNFLLILIVDLELLPKGTISDMLDTASIYSFLVAMAGSLIETVIFLKTLNVNTMMTNTAGKIVSAMTIFCYVLAVINTLVLPSTKKSEILFCEFLSPKGLFIVTLPGTLVFVMVLSVIGYAVFRGLQIRRTNFEIPDNISLEELEYGHESGVRRLNVTPPPGRLFTIQAVISELDQKTPRQIIEDDLVIQDIENRDSNIDMDNVTIVEMGCVQHVPLPGIDMIMKTIHKYLKNTMISLLILTSLLPSFSTGLYGFITNLGCEDPTIKTMAEMSEYGCYVLTIFLPVFIKLKLDRLNE